MKKAASEAEKPEAWAWEQFAKGIAIERVSEAAEIAAVVSFLAGPDSNYITGQSILVDGGIMLRNNYEQNRKKALYW